ncbi:MAG: hypothetical protein NPINA01_08190 [Nitrospinaceae bacterium]|nr:MAG: hypothetical protein NPINA01_08190 [Nitrospinaceae bacterium]
MLKKYSKLAGYLLFAFLLPSNPLSSGSVFADQNIDREPTIKAGLILKFSNFIRWPEFYSSTQGEEPLNICLHGEEEFGDIFDYINDHGILRREILVRRHVPLDRLGTCHLIYTSFLDKPEMDQLAGEIKNAPTLVVTEADEITHSLVAINFKKVNNRMHFEINRSAFERSGIMVSSELLNLALDVVRID